MLSLNIANTKVSDAGVAHLAPLVHVEELSVAETAVTEAGLKKLGHWPLKTLEISGDRFGRDWIRQYRAQYPERYVRAL